MNRGQDNSTGEPKPACERTSPTPSSLAAWRKVFDLHGRRYSLFKRLPTASAPFCIQFQVAPARYRFFCLGTADLLCAVERASAVIQRPGQRFAWQVRTKPSGRGSRVATTDPLVVEVRGRRYRLFQRVAGGSWCFIFEVCGRRVKRSLAYDLGEARELAAVLIAEQLDAGPGPALRRQLDQAEAARAWGARRLGPMPILDISVEPQNTQNPYE